MSVKKAPRVTIYPSTLRIVLKGRFRAWSHHLSFGSFDSLTKSSNSSRSTLKSAFKLPRIWSVRDMPREYTLSSDFGHNQFTCHFGIVSHSSCITTEKYFPKPRTPECSLLGECQKPSCESDRNSLILRGENVCCHPRQNHMVLTPRSLTSEWPVIRPPSRIDHTEACQSIRFRFLLSYLLALITFIKYG